MQDNTASGPRKSISQFLTADFRLEFLVPASLVFCGYYAGVLAGMTLKLPAYPVSVMWPPNAILTAALVLTPIARWGWLLAAALMAHLMAEMGGGVPASMAISWFISNCAESLLGAICFRWIVKSPVELNRVRHLSVLLVLVGLVSPVLSSFLDATLVLANHYGSQSYGQVFQMRFFSNSLAGVLIVPTLICWGTEISWSWRTFGWGRWLEGAVVALGLGWVSWAIFCGSAAAVKIAPIYLYAPLPMLLLIALRFALRGISLAILCMASVAIWGAVRGHGPFLLESPEENARGIQIFFSGIGALLMLLSAAIAERGKAEERFVKAFHANRDAIIITRQDDGRILDVNKRWEEMFGYTRAEAIGRSTKDLEIYHSESDRDLIVAGITSARGVQDLELCLRTRTGELRHALISGNSEVTGDGRCLIVTVQDISDRRRAEEAQQNLERASRLVVMGELTAMIAHEINQPLGAILSNAEAAEMLLEVENPPLGEIRQILSDIRENDLHAERAIRQMRDLLSKRQMEMGAVNVNEIAMDALRLTAGDLLRRRIQVRREFYPELPLAFGDRGCIQQILLNLVVNAMDAMKESLMEERRMTLRTQLHGERDIEIIVMDRGHGIKPDQLPYIFKSFYTTKKDGMGLGLSIVQSIVSAHQGTVWAENNAERGTSLHVVFRNAENFKLTNAAKS